ncbi:metabotropic glutamate receptor 3-like [Saccostrea cucullata]|uniref:metabotropic glutamate receptor 3-like n=1 Tax=Saccostrea cuccullata TaxID=36930 RepID=UPI002ED09679
MLQPARDQSSNGATLLAVLPIHKRGTDPYLCGHLDIGVFYNALAFIFTLDKYFPTTKYKLRGLVVDSCSNNLRVDQDLYSLFSRGRLCNTEFSFDGEISNKTLAGVITSTSDHVMAANRVLAPLRVPIISNSATSTALSDKEKYPYFARTVPPDNFQMDVIARILKNKNWNSASVIYSSDTYGRTLFEYFLTRTSALQTCAGAQIAVPYPATLEQAKDAIRYIESDSKSKVIVLISTDPKIVLQAAKDLNVLDKYVWIGTDTWGASLEVVSGMEGDLLGSITVEPRSTPVEEFAKYVSELTFNERKGIPDDWFEEFYQMFHKCNIQSAKVNFPQYSACTGSETIADWARIDFQPYVLNTIAATYAYAKAIDVVSNGRCLSTASFEECFRVDDSWNELFSRILNVEWNIQNSLKLSRSFILKFNNDRFWDVGYNIKTLSTSTGYQDIGSLISDSFQFSSNYDNNKGNNWSPCRSTAVCDCLAPVVSAQTGNDTLRRVKASEPRNYLFYNIMNTTINNQFVPIYDLTYKWPIWAIAVAVPTCVGLFITFFLFLYLLIFYEIRGGTTILGFMTMLGILGIYAINFAFFLPAATDTCGARQFCMGVVYAIVFAALLVKAVDNWRFGENVDYFNQQQINEKYKGITGTGVLLLIALGIVCVQLIIPIQWLVHRPPSASLMTDATEIHDWMMCDPHDMYDKALVMSMIFVMFLVLLTAIFSAMAWDSDNNNYESRWILVSSVCTAGCFMVWMIVITNASPPYRDAAVALGNFFNATAILIFTIIRKVVIMLWPRSEEMEEEKPGSIIDERANDVYSTVYSNPGYDNDDAVFQPSSPRQSELDNGDVGF